MASKGKINDIIDFPAIEGQKKQMIGAIDEIIARMEKVSKYAISLGIEFKGADSIAAVTKLQKEFVTVEEETNKILKDTINLTAKYESRLNGEAAQLAKTQEDLKKVNKDLRDNAKLNAAAEGSIEKMRLTLSKMKKEWAETGDAAKRNELGQSISVLNSEILEAEKSIGVFGRQVGNYEIAGKSLRGELRELTEEIGRMKIAGEDSGEAYDALVRKTGEMKDAMNDAAAEIAKHGSDTKVFDVMLSASEGAAGAFSSLQGASALLGVENENLEKTFVKLQAAMTLLNGLKSVQLVLQKESAAYTAGQIVKDKISLAIKNLQTSAETKGIVARKLATAAQWLLNLAMKANPAGLLIGLFAALTGAAILLFKVFKSGTDTTKQYNTAIDQSKASVESLNKELDRNVKFMEAQGASQLSIINAKKKAAQQEFDIQSNLVDKLRALGGKKTDEQKQQLEDAIKAQEESWSKIVALNDEALVLDFKQRQELSRLKIDNMKDGFKKEIALINLDYDEKIKNAEGNNELIAQLEIQRGIKKNEVIKKYDDIAKKQADDVMEEVKKRQEEEQRIIEEAEKEKISDKQAYYDFVKRMTEKQKESLSQETQQSLLTISRNQENEMRMLDDQLKNKLISVEDYEKRKNDILYKYSQESIKIAIDEAKKQLEIANLTAGEQLAIKQKLVDLEKQLREGDTEHFRENETGKKEFKIETDEEALEYAKGINDQLTAISDTIFNGQMAKLDAEAKRDEELKAAELERAGNNQAMKDQIEAKYSAKAKQREQERRKLEIQKAKQDKALGIINAIINTALGIAKTIGTMGMPLAIPFIALTAALGAAQVAAIASQPIPQYFKGREDGPAEMAIVGERGSEGIELPGGKTYLTPSRPTLTFLPEHARVIPHQELLQAAGAFSMSPIERLPESYGHDYHELKNEIAGLKTCFDKVVKAINDKQELHINITERGLQAAAQRGANFTRYLNQNVRL